MLTPLFGVLRTSFRLFIPLMVTTVVSIKVAGRSGPCVIGVYFMLVTLKVVKLIYSVATRCFTTGTTAKIKAKVERKLFRRVRGFAFARVSRLKASALVAQVADSVGRVRSNIGLILQLFLHSPFVMFNTVVVTFAMSIGTTLMFIIAVPLLSLVIFKVVLIAVPVCGGIRTSLSRMLLTAERGLAKTEIVHTFGGRRSRAGQFRGTGRVLASTRGCIKHVSKVVGPLACVVMGKTVVTLVCINTIHISVKSLARKRIITLVGCVSRVLIRLIGLTGLVVSIAGTTTYLGHIRDILTIGPSVGRKSME